MNERTLLFQDFTTGSRKVWEGAVDRGGLFLAWAPLCGPVPQRLDLPRGTQEVPAIGAEHQKAEPHLTGRRNPCMHVVSCWNSSTATWKGVWAGCTPPSSSCAVFHCCPPTPGTPARTLSFYFPCLEQLSPLRTPRQLLLVRAQNQAQRPEALRRQMPPPP